MNERPLPRKLKKSLSTSDNARDFLFYMCENYYLCVVKCPIRYGNKKTTSNREKESV